jgi:hypothetical protein
VLAGYWLSRLKLWLKTACIPTRSGHIGSMKLEIDIGNKAELRRLQGELSRYLKVIEFALLEGHSSDNGSGTREIPLNGGSVAPNEGVLTVLSLIDALPKTFNSSDLYQNTKEIGISRGVVKAALQDAIEGNKIEEIQKGIGRRPSKYRKI